MTVKLATCFGYALFGQFTEAAYMSETAHSLNSVEEWADINVLYQDIMTLFSCNSMLKFVLSPNWLTGNRFENAAKIHLMDRNQSVLEEVSEVR